MINFNIHFIGSSYLGINYNNIIRLRFAWERVKHEPYSDGHLSIKINNFFGNLDFSETLHKAVVSEMARSVISGVLPLISAILEQSNLRKDEIHRIVLVGDTTSSNPIASEVLKDFFVGREPSAEPRYSVAVGAALAAARLYGHSRTGPEDQNHDETGSIASTDSSRGEQAYEVHETTLENITRTEVSQNFRILIHSDCLQHLSNGITTIVMGYRNGQSETTDFYILCFIMRGTKLPQVLRHTMSMSIISFWPRIMGEDDSSAGD